MNGIKFRTFCLSLLAGLVLFSCKEVNDFTEDVFVYEPHGELVSIARLREYAADQAIGDDVRVQGTVTTSDAQGNFARQVVIQDATGAIMLDIDMGASADVYPKGGQLSVQCQGLTLAEVGGVLQLASGVTGEGIRKQATAMDNRRTRGSVFLYGVGEAVTPVTLQLSGLDVATRAYESQLVTLGDVFFQTTLLPFANAGGSSEQYRTLYNSEGLSVLLCTRDASTMAAMMLPEGTGTATGILSYPGGTAQIMVSSIDDIGFAPGGAGYVDPDDEASKLFISEYYNSGGKCYIELYNSGAETFTLADYALATDTGSDGVFNTTLGLGTGEIAPGGVVLLRNEAADVIPWTDTPAATWDPLRTNYSGVRLDPLSLDGNSQIALMKDGRVVDLPATTHKYNWALDKTFIRRPGIDGHSKSSDFTRADAGWITRVSGYHYNLGYHRYWDTDPDMDIPAIAIPRTILEVRGMAEGLVDTHIKITGRVTSDRAGGNVEENRLYMQDGSNRGICVEFLEGQAHGYDPGDEIEVELYGTTLESRSGLLIAADAMAARSRPTGAPNQMPEAIEASVEQITNLQSMYIYIKDVQVSAFETGRTYGEGYISCVDLFAEPFSLSTLSSAGFASATVSQLSGVMKGIATVDGTAKLLAPRNADDLASLDRAQFTPITAESITVPELKAMEVGTITRDVRVTVSVVSDFTGGNYPSENVICVQDATRGFLLRLPAANTHAFGQSLIVVLKNATVTMAGGSSRVCTVTPASAEMIVPVGAPDPAIQPVTVSGTASDYTAMLVTIPNIDVSEADRLKRFDGSIVFDVKGSATTKVTVQTNASAEWNGAYIPTATGSVVGLMTGYAPGNITIHPRRTADLSGLPAEGTRNDGEKVVYFEPSTDAAADLFISEAVMGNVDANGLPIATVARNNCNAKFVELFNPTGGDLELSDYRVACIKYNNAVARGTVFYYRFPEGLVLSAGRTAVFKYVSSALGTSNAAGGKMTNTIWPKGYTADNALTAAQDVIVHTDAVPGVILFSDTRDFAKSIANATTAFPCFDGNDILVVQKTSDDGATWTEIDRLFSLKTGNGTIGGGVKYPYLYSYARKQGVLGLPGNLTDVQDAEYSSVVGGRNRNDFDSARCDPDSEGSANWTRLPINSFDDLGVHAFSVKP